MDASTRHQQQHADADHEDDADAPAAILELPPPPLPPQHALRGAFERLRADGGESAPRRIYVLMHGAAAAAPPPPSDPESQACTPRLLDELRRVFAAAAAAGAATADVVPVLPFARPSAAASSSSSFPGARSVLSLRGGDAARDLARAFAVAEAAQLEVIEWPSPEPSGGADAGAGAAPPTSTPTPSTTTLSFPDVAVGGTFDRLHAGHRLLLAATALVASERVFAGVTADALLRAKSHRELLQPYDRRARAADAYMRRVRPGLRVTTGALRDPAEPTQAELDGAMRALVVSRETVAGGDAINAGRARRGLEPLELVVVGLVGEEEGEAGVADKLSSTALREREGRRAEGEEGEAGRGGGGGGGGGGAE